MTNKTKEEFQKLVNVGNIGINNHKFEMKKNIQIIHEDIHCILCDSNKGVIYLYNDDEYSDLEYFQCPTDILPTDSGILGLKTIIEKINKQEYYSLWTYDYATNKMVISRNTMKLTMTCINIRYNWDDDWDNGEEYTEYLTVADIRALEKYFFGVDADLCIDIRIGNSNTMRTTNPYENTIDELIHVLQSLYDKYGKSKDRVDINIHFYMDYDAIDQIIDKRT